MPEEEWIRILKDGRKVKFTRLELPEDSAFITAGCREQGRLFDCVDGSKKSDEP